MAARVLCDLDDCDGEAETTDENGVKLCLDHLIELTAKRHVAAELPPLGRPPLLGQTIDTPYGPQRVIGIMIEGRGEAWLDEQPPAK